jgi:hypothetical protein
MVCDGRWTPYQGSVVCNCDLFEEDKQYYHPVGDNGDKMRRIDDLSPDFIARAKAAIARLEIIRDCFLEGRDAEAVALIREEDPVTSYTVIGINSGAAMVGPGEVFTVVMRPQVRSFRGRQFMISRRSFDFDILDIRVGNRSQFIQSTKIASDLFAGPEIDAIYTADDPENPLVIRCNVEAKTHMGLRFDTEWCQTSQDLVIYAQNVGAVPRFFYSAFLGEFQK